MFFPCSLAILIYNKTRNAFVIVKQFRPGTYQLHIVNSISIDKVYLVNFLYSWLLSHHLHARLDLILFIFYSCVHEQESSHVGEFRDLPK